MAYMIGRVAEKINVPFGVNVLWDPISTIALAASTSNFVREIFTGTMLPIWEIGALMLAKLCAIEIH